jgi:hypothetical protein
MGSRSEFDPELSFARTESRRAESAAIQKIRA